MIETPSGLDVFAQPERPGLVFDLDERTYHGGTNSLSASSAKILLGKRPPNNVEALEFGTLVHSVLLEPDKAANAYVALDPYAIGVKADGTPADNPRATKAWKTAVAKAKNDGHQVVAPQDWEKANRMADAIRKHPDASEILEMCPHREVSAYAELEPGVIIRGRFDLFGPGVIADAKSLINANPADFGRLAYDYGYHISDAAYLLIAELLGLDVDRFLFINVEKEPNLAGDYRVSVVELTPRAIAKGRREFLEAVRRWVALGKRVELPDYPTGVQECDLPPWAYYNEPAETEIPADFEWSVNDYS